MINISFTTTRAALRVLNPGVEVLRDSYPEHSVRYMAWGELAVAIRTALAHADDARQITFPASLEALLEGEDGASMGSRAVEEGDKHRDSSAGRRAAWHKLADGIGEALRRHQAIRVGDLVRHVNGIFGLVQSTDRVGYWSVVFLVNDQGGASWPWGDGLDSRGQPQRLNICFDLWRAVQIREVVHVADSVTGLSKTLMLVEKMP